MRPAMGATRSDLESQGRQIVEQLGGKWSNNGSGGGGMCRCPAHNDSSPSLSVRVGDTTLLFHCFAGCETADVMRELRRGGQARAGGVYHSDTGATGAPANLQGVIDRLWAESRPLGRSIAAKYLEGRGLVTRSAQLRFHPRVQLGRASDATWHPALLAAVRDDIGLVAIHRTFLDPATGGKASFDNPKRLLGTPGAGTVRLGTATRALGLAEGIETALAATLIHDIPVWAVLGNERFSMVTIPNHVERLVILADNDAGGRRAVALALAGQEHSGRTIEVIWPPAALNDWADALVAERATVVAFSAGRLKHPLTVNKPFIGSEEYCIERSYVVPAVLRKGGGAGRVYWPTGDQS